MIRWLSKYPLLTILALSALVRFGLWWAVRQEPIHPGDEIHYHELAQSLVEGRGFFLEGRASAMRPPLYPLAVAGLYELFGPGNFQAVRAVQLLLGLATAAGSFLLGRMLYDRRVGLWAAGLVAFYPPLLGIAVFLYTETLFAFWLVGLGMAGAWALRQKVVWPWLVVGLLLALAALTRSVLWPFVPVLAGLILLLWRQVGWDKRLVGAALMLAGFIAVVAPWSWRCTRLEQTFIVIDTIGGRNLMMGNYEYTPLDRAWDAISLEGEKAWYAVLRQEYPEFGALTQGQRDKLALRYALRYMMAHPGQTLQRSLVKFFNFWQLERTTVAALERGWFGGLGRAAVLAWTAVLCGSYAVAMLAAVAGLVLIPPADRRTMLVLLSLIGFVCVVHTVVFAHSRYHLPLAPLELVFAGAVLAYWGRQPKPIHSETSPGKIQPQPPGDKLGSSTPSASEVAVGSRPKKWQYGLVVLCWLVLVAGWLWEILWVDWPKVQKILGG
ncbi:MAG: glycosyltransferase family 39 protein [Thermoguttaceae bacterium]|nr:glycosyltransferase family 39 protein [Thermoguttaceae bacterium]MDW8038771.1 glycosyltransferase family 39 protein [Thermoguttaceae bacterium]